MRAPAPRVGDHRVVVALSSAYLRGLINGLRRTDRGTRRWRAAAVLGAAAFWLLVFLAVRSGTGQLHDLVPFADRVALKGLELLFAILLGAMTYSSVLVALVHLYTAQDLRLLGALPATDRALYFAKWIEVGLVSGWAPVSFGAAVIAGVGAGLQAPWGYYPVAALALALLVSIPVSLAMGLTTAAVNVFPANRTRDVLVFSSLVLLLAIFVAIRTMRPERLVDPTQLRQLTEVVARLHAPGSWWLPSTWMAGLLAPWLLAGPHPSPGSGWAAGACLAGGAAGACAAGLAVFVPLFRRGVSQTLSSRGRTRAGAGLGLRLLTGLTDALPAPVAAVARKDLLQFARDPSQWSQLLLLSALAAIYLINVRLVPLDQMRAVGLDPATAADLFTLVNVLFVGFVLSAVALRFSFSGISLEGRSAWIVLTSPLGPERLLAAKAAPGAALLGTFGALLTGGSVWILGPSLPLALLSLAATAWLAVAVAALGVGLGAVAPSFRAESPARIAGSVGGLVFMITSLCLVVFEVALLAYPAYLLSRAAPASPPAVAAGAALGALALIAPAAGAATALLLGRRALAAARVAP